MYLFVDLLRMVQTMNVANSMKPLTGYSRARITRPQLLSKRCVTSSADRAVVSGRERNLCLDGRGALKPSTVRCRPPFPVAVDTFVFSHSAQHWVHSVCARRWPEKASWQLPQSRSQSRILRGQNGTDEAGHQRVTNVRSSRVGQWRTFYTKS